MPLRFISKTKIGLSTLLLSPLLGTILFSYNLNAVGKRPWSWLVMLVGIIWTFAVPKMILPLTGNILLASFVSNAFASAILVTLVWNRMLGEHKIYEDRPGWKPIIVFTTICVALLLIQWLAARK
jgi:hypothetical protein